MSANTEQFAEGRPVQQIALSIDPLPREILEGYLRDRHGEGIYSRQEAVDHLEYLRILRMRHVGDPARLAQISCNFAFRNEVRRLVVAD